MPTTYDGLLLDQGGALLNVMSSAYGARGDGAWGDDASISSGSATMSTVASSFASGDVGKTITIRGAASGGLALTTTISGYTSSTQVTLATTAGASVAGAAFVFGTDDTAALASVFAAVASAGRGTAFFPAGNFMISGAMSIPTNTVLHFAGGARLKALSRLSDGSGMLSLSQVSGVTLINPTIDGSNDVFDLSAGKDAAQYYGVWIDRCSEIAIIGGHVFALPLGDSGVDGGDGILIFDSTNSLVPSEFWRVIGVEMSGNSRNGMSVVSGRYGVISENHIHDNGFNGLDIEPNNANDVVVQVVVSANVVRANSSEGIVAKAGDAFTVGPVGLVGNTIEENGKSGIDVQWFTNVPIVGNVIRNNAQVVSGSPTGSGIYLYHAAGAIIVGNHVSGANQQYCIKDQDGTSPSVIAEGNQLVSWYSCGTCGQYTLDGGAARVNNLGWSAGVPTASEWEVGNVVQNTNDNTFWIKDANDTMRQLWAGRLVALSDAATIALDASTGTSFQVTIGGNRTIGAPTNPAIGQRITLLVQQDATGGRTLSWNGVFKQGWSNSGNGAHKRTSISFVYDGTNWNQESAQAPYV